MRFLWTAGWNSSGTQSFSGTVFLNVSRGRLQDAELWSRLGLGAGQGQGAGRKVAVSYPTLQCSVYPAWPYPLVGVWLGG